MNRHEFEDVLKYHNAILFGSRAFKCSTDSSDYDYLVSLDSFNVIMEKLKESNETIEPSLYYLNSCYVVLFEGSKAVHYNLVTYKEDDKDAWLGVIEMVKHAPGYVLHNKDKRKLIFESLLGQLKYLKKLV